MHNAIRLRNALLRRWTDADDANIEGNREGNRTENARDSLSRLRRCAILRMDRDSRQRVTCHFFVQRHA